MLLSLYILFRFTRVIIWILSNTRKAVAHRKRDEQTARTRRTTCLHAAQVHVGNHRYEQRAGPVRLFAVRRSMRGQHIA